jgi:hypothetical protein
MKCAKSFNKFFVLLGSLGLIFGGLITACGSSDSMGLSDPTRSTQSGTVALLLTDGPTEEFSQVNVTVNEVSLLSDSREPVILFSGARRIDLLALQEVEDLFMIHEGVPAGIYNKIRLRVSDPEFICNQIDLEKCPTGKITSDRIHLVANGKVDLVPDHPFQVLPGETLVVRLDLDANKSILIHLSSESMYQFRPVVFVEVLDKLPARAVFVDGEIASINPETHSFLLKRPHPIFHTLDLSDRPMVEENDDVRCLIRVVVSDETRIFDASGLPGTFDSLVVGQHVKVRGLISFEAKLHIQALLIEIGNFIPLHGLITSAVDSDNRFGFQPDPGQGITGGLIVQLHPETLIIEARTHEQLGPEDLVVGKSVLIEGVIHLESEPDLFHAALIVVKPDEVEPTHFEGIVQDLNLEARTFNLAVILPCEPLCLPILQQIILVHVLPEAVIIRIHYGKDGHLEIEPILFDSIKEGDRVHAFGQFDASGTPFHAKAVVVEAVTEEVSFETIARGVNSGITEERLEAIRDQTTWDEFWKLHAGEESSIPSIDFEKEWVIVVHLGTRSSGGYSVVITNVEHTDSQLMVHYSEIIPGPGCLVPAVITHPHHIIKVPRIEMGPSFLKTEQIIQCKVE